MKKLSGCSTGRGNQGDPGSLLELKRCSSESRDAKMARVHRAKCQRKRFIGEDSEYQIVSLKYIPFIVYKFYLIELLKNNYKKL